MGKPADWFDHVTDRPGHDLRYAIDATKLRTETGWTPALPRRPRRPGRRRSTWYQDNEDWWRPTKVVAEAKYARTQRS